MSPPDALEIHLLTAELDPESSAQRIGNFISELEMPKKTCLGCNTLDSVSDNWRALKFGQKSTAGSF